MHFRNSAAFVENSSTASLYLLMFQGLALSPHHPCFSTSDSILLAVDIISPAAQTSQSSGAPKRGERVARIFGPNNAFRAPVKTVAPNAPRAFYRNRPSEPLRRKPIH